MEVPIKIDVSAIQAFCRRQRCGGEKVVLVISIFWKTIKIYEML